MSHDAVHFKARWALFLDVDGTLIELAETPESVYVPPELKTLLNDVADRLDGALALVSGRTIAALDALFEPLVLCASGVHGAERRGHDGKLIRVAQDTNELRAAHTTLAAFARAHEGTVLEDKGFALAVHFRLAPHLDESVRDLTHRVVAELGPKYVVQPGKFVYEIRPSTATKGTALRAFMCEPPFAGRFPVFLGDDVTDEDAFEVVNALGGLSICVGNARPTRAQRRLEDVADVHRWLRELLTDAPLARTG